MSILETLARSVCDAAPSALTDMTRTMREHIEMLKQDREAHMGTIEVARSNYVSDDIEIDDTPDVSIGGSGVWVSAWVWVPIEEFEDEN